MKKICTKCKQEKDISEFYFCKAYKNNCRSICKKCIAKINGKNQEIKIRKKIYKCIVCGKVIPFKDNKHRRNYCDNCREIEKKSSWKKYYKENKGKESERKKLWYQKKALIN